MADLAQQFRRLNAADITNTEKLQTARHLACLFTQQGLQAISAQHRAAYSLPQHSPSPDAATDVRSMPVSVRTHYMKLLLDWTQSALIKGKLNVIPQASADDQLQNLQCTWQLLSVLLMSIDTSAQTAPNISLIAAAAAACKACSPEQARSQTGQVLAVALQQSLLTLNTKFKQSFRASLEHSTALMSSILVQVSYAGQSSAALKACQDVAAQAALQLTDVAATHPNQKKVFNAIVTKQMLLAIAEAIWSAESSCSDTANDSAAADKAASLQQPDRVRSQPEAGTHLAVLLKQLLHKVIFHPSNLEGLLELSSSFSSQYSGPSGAKASEAPRSYHFQLLQVIKDAVADAPTSSAASTAFTHLLSWLAESFAIIIKQHKTDILTPPATSQTATPAQTALIPLSADFTFSAMLLQPLLLRMQQPAHTAAEADVSQTANTAGSAELAGRSIANKKPNRKRKAKDKDIEGQQQGVSKTDAVPMQWATAAKGVAMLVGIMAEGNIYRPTEDSTGSHRQLLTAVADAALKQAQQMLSADIATGTGEHKQHNLIAVCDVLSSILAVEHRAVQPHLLDIWQLLWQAAADHDGKQVATDVAVGLVTAYAELRQLQFLLQSLLDSLAAQLPVTAHDIICNANFVAKLQQVVQGMPSGQAVPMLKFISSSVACLAAISDKSSAQAAVGHILAACLASIRVELIPAPSLAQAAGQLLKASLQPALAPLLLSMAGKAQQPDIEKQPPAAVRSTPTLQHTKLGDGKKPGMLSLDVQHTQQEAMLDVGSKEQLLCCLLRLYHGAVEVHGQCAGMQPQVDPLPGQASGLPQQGSASQAAQQGQNNGYFDALWQADAAVPVAATHLDLPTLWAVVGQSNTGSNSSLHAALVSCSLQRLDTLHEQLLHLQYTCAFKLITDPPLPDPADTDQQQSAATPDVVTAARAAEDDITQPSPVVTNGVVALEGSLASASQAVTHQPSTAALTADAVMLDGAAERALLRELQQLSNQILQHACSSLQPSSSPQGAADLTPTSQTATPHRPQSQVHLSSVVDADTEDAIWQQAADRLPLLATYASAVPLQIVMNALIQIACCSSNSLSMASLGDMETTAKLSTASSKATAMLCKSRLWQQGSIQQAWLHALHAQLWQCCLKGQATAAPEPKSSAKRRKRDAAQQAPEHCSSIQLPSLYAAEPSAEEHDTFQMVLQDTCASVQAHLQSGKASDSMPAPASTGKKRKSAPLSSLGLPDQMQSSPTRHQQLRNIGVLLQHAAQVTSKQLLVATAVPLASVMLQTQAWLVQQLLATGPVAPRQQDTSVPTSPSVAEHTATDRCQQHNSAMMLHSLASAQAVLTCCLQSAPDAVADSLLLFAPALWQWFTAAAQLTQHLATRSTSQPTMSDHEQQPPAEAMSKLEGVCENMLAHTSVCMMALVSFHMGVRHTSASSTVDVGAQRASAHQEFLHFVTDTATALKAEDGEDAAVIAEACLAAAVQAAAAASPAKRKKALAAVVIGPEQAITHCIQPGHLQQIASILQPAVSSCLQTQMQALVQMPAVSVQQHHQGFTTAKAQPSRTAAMGSKTCALFGCLGQLWELQSKTSSGSSTQAASSAGMTVDMGQSKTAGPGQNNDLLAHGKNSKREQGDSESEEDAMSDGSSTDGSSSEVVVVDQEEGMKAAHQQMPGDEMHEAFSAQQDGEGDAAVLHAGKGADLNRLVWDLKVMLGKPWSFQAESGETSGRWQLPIRCGQHLLACLQAAVHALSALPTQPEGLWAELLAMHLHILGSMIPLLQAPEPLRHAGSAPMGMPSLVIPTDPQSAPLTRLRRALLLSLRDLVQGSSREQSQQLLKDLSTCLTAASRPLQALHYLEAILLALETPRSHRGLQALAKHSKPLAAALLGFLSSTARAQHIQDKSFGTATAQGTAGMSAMPLQAALSSFGRHALPTLKTASDSLEMQTDILLQQQQQQEHVAAQVASISTAHRCLESMLAREAVFSLPAAAIAQALHSPAAVFNTGASMSSAGAWSVRQGTGVYVGCCSLLLAGLRHHAKAIRRCMALVAASTRALLQMLMHWALPDSSGNGDADEKEALLVLCSNELAQLYTIVAADKAALGKYCVYLLADYITLAAAPPLDNRSVSSVGAGDTLLEALAGAPANALRQGALALYGACSPAELQHLHAKLSGASSGVQRSALADLRREYQSDYKYTGKV